jgi:GntR family transcriptional regulator
MLPSQKRETARYVQLADIFRRLIAQDDWPIGCRLPTVAGLAAEHGVARITVRQAMDILDGEGLIDRSPGRGMHVTAAPAVLRWHALTAEWDDFMRVGGGSSKTLAERSHAALPDLGPDAKPIAGKFHYMQVVGHRDGGPPLSVREVYIRDDAYRLIRERVEREPMLNLLAEQAVRVAVVNEIAAASRDVAGWLRVPIGTPVLRARHIGFGRNGNVVFIDFPILRGDYVKFEISVARPAN